MAVIRKLAGQKSFNAIFGRVGGWASVVSTPEWRRPWKFMGPIEYGKKRREAEIARITVRIVHQTEKAWLLRANGKEFWFPKSWGDLDIDEVTGWAALAADIYKLREKGVAPHDNGNRLPQDDVRQHHRADLCLLVSE